MSRPLPPHPILHLMMMNPAPCPLLRGQGRERKDIEVWDEQANCSICHSDIGDTVESSLHSDVHYLRTTLMTVTMLRTVRTQETANTGDNLTTPRGKSSSLKQKKHCLPSIHPATPSSAPGTPRSTGINRPNASTHLRRFHPVLLSN